MDVTCEQCGTRYEFDEALVSTKGTTVKCTSCGHQFKVHRPGAGGHDGWLVRKLDGRILRYDAMRELQAAINRQEITPADRLVPESSDQPERALGDIEELRTFFHRDDLDLTAPFDENEETIRRRRVDGKIVDRDGNSVETRTGDTLAPAHGPLDGEVSVAIPPPARVPQHSIPFDMQPPAASTAPLHRVNVTGDAMGAEPTQRRAPTKRTPPPPRPRRAAATTQPRRQAPTTTPAGSSVAARATAASTAVPARARVPAPAPSEVQVAAVDNLKAAVDDALGRARKATPVPDASASIPIDAEPLRDARPSELGSPAILAAESPIPEARRPSLSDIESLVDDPDELSAPLIRAARGDGGAPDARPRFSSYGAPPPKEPGWGRWMIGLLALGLAAVGGYILISKLKGDDGPVAAPTPTVDPRIKKFVERGRAQLDNGEVDAAKDEFVKASGLAENDPVVAQALAEIAIVQADLLWLHRRLLGDDAPAASTVTQMLARATQHAQKTANVAKTLKAQEAAVLQIDALRLQDKVTAARALVASVSTKTPYSGRALAVLDLADPSPSYPSVIERLRAAARAERKLGRAQAFLVYALQRSGDPEGAAAALRDLESRSPRHALIAPLKRYLAENPTTASSGAPDTPVPVASASTTAPATTSGGASDVGIDFREALSRANAARSAGDLGRAESLYQSVLAQDPGNSEALAGLADIRRDRGDSGSAEKAYQEILGQNPDYIPAMMNLANIKWQNGDRAAAKTIYSRVLREAPGTSYAVVAKQRLNTPDPAPKPTATPTPEPTTTPAPAPAPDPADDTPTD